MDKPCKWIFILAIMLGSAWRIGSQTILEPLNRQVALAGELRKVHGYGPPGYGENKRVDSPIEYWVLEPPNPVNTICTPEKPQWAVDDCKAAKQIKLFFPTSPANNGLERKAKSMKGTRVIATGILHRADTVGEITPIYMNVIALQSARAPQKP
jgi:hypothetical protein